MAIAFLRLKKCLGKIGRRRNLEPTDSNHGVFWDSDNPSFVNGLVPSKLCNAVPVPVVNEANPATSASYQVFGAGFPCDTDAQVFAPKNMSFATFIPLVAILLMPAVGWTGTPQGRVSAAPAAGAVANGTAATSAGPTGTPAVESAIIAKAASDNQLVKVTISTSRTEVTSDGGYGIFADLQNMDAVPLTLRAAETMLVIQPELGDDRRRIFAVDGFYPTEERPDDMDKKVVREIVLQPSEHYVAFWDVLGRRADAGVSTAWGFLRWFDAASTYVFERLAFVPGNYAFVVVGKAYRNVNGTREQTYHTYTDQVKLHVSLTQIDAMLAAAIGGILGYIVVALRADGDFSKYSFFGRHRPRADGDSASAFSNLKAWLIVGRNMFSAALISAVVTILLSRISDTQFPIKVSIADFWGALTVGFVAYFVGNKLIDRIVGFSSKGSGGDGSGGQGTPSAPLTPSVHSGGPAPIRTTTERAHAHENDSLQV